MMLCFISVIGIYFLMVCSKDYSVPIFEWEQGKVGFSIFVKVDPCAVASLPVVLKGINFGCKIFISFQVEVLCILDFLKGVGLSKFFLLVIAFL